jgi:hypothetical protein
VACAGNHAQLFFAHQVRGRFAIQGNDRRVAPADQQQRRRGDGREGGSAGKIGTPAARYHRADFAAELGSGAQGRRRPGAGPEIADRQAGGERGSACPCRGQQKPPAQQRDIEPVPVHAILDWRQQVEKQGADRPLMQARGDHQIAGAEMAAAAAVSEDDETACGFRDEQAAFQPPDVGGNVDVVGRAGAQYRHADQAGRISIGIRRRPNRSLLRS